VSPEQLKYFTELDFKNHVALVATMEKDGAEEIIAVGRYIVGETDASPKSAEIAFAVADDYQGHGIGRTLLKRLASLAASTGIVRFEALVHTKDAPLLSLLEHSGFAVDEETEFGRVRVVLEL
jgi:GNAT superfamily N-acetyltransferase